VVCFLARICFAQTVPLTSNRRQQFERARTPSPDHALQREHELEPVHCALPNGIFIANCPICCCAHPHGTAHLQFQCFFGSMVLFAAEHEHTVDLTFLLGRRSAH
jgi:hypothetical protein